LPDSVSAVHNATNATRDLESEVEAVQDGRREFVVDNIEKDPRVIDVDYLFYMKFHLYIAFLLVSYKLAGISCKLSI